MWIWATAALAISPVEAVRADAVSADGDTVTAACSATGLGSSLLAGAGMSGLTGGVFGMMIDPAGLYRIRIAGEGWVEVTLPLKDAAVALMQAAETGGARVPGGWRMAQGTPPATRPADLGLLADFDDGPGCVMYMETKADPQFSVGLQLPEQGPIRARLRGDVSAPPLVATAATRGPRPATRTVPDATLRIGVDGEALLLLLPLLGDKAPELPAGADLVAKRIASGIELARFGAETAVVVPLRGFLGGPGRGRIRRAMGDEVAWTGKWDFIADLGKDDILGTVARGRVLFATTPALLAEVAAGDGAVWVPEPAAHALVMELHPGAQLDGVPMFDGDVREPWSVRIDAADGYWVVAADTGVSGAALLQQVLSR
jgi:hypothetical protein